jgi:hypothetical protein
MQELFDHTTFDCFSSGECLRGNYRTHRSTHKNMNRKKFQLFIDYVLNIPLPVWVLVGFSISYVLFFLRPIFLTFQVMQFHHYIPVQNPIGIDLKQMLNYCESWLEARQAPYIGRNLYPPFASVFFTPLLIVDSSWAYKIVTFTSVFSYVMITFIFPFLINKEKQTPLILMLIFLTGLFSYGFQFELERGQFNVIAVFLCFIAIWIYHNHNKYRYIAYALFTISVQLKVFPLIFIIVFISNWQDWRKNIRRLLLLSLVNFAKFFILGLNVFFDFVNAIETQIRNPYVWTGNHSIFSFVYMISKSTFDLDWKWLDQNTSLIRISFMIIILVCIFIVIQKATQQKQKGLNSFLLLVCTIGALLIPPISHDYTLSFLAAPVAIFLSSDDLYKRQDGTFSRLVRIVFICVFSIAYSSTLVSGHYKPFIIQNNFLALFVMLFIITLFSILSKPILKKMLNKKSNTIYKSAICYFSKPCLFS